MSDCTSAGLADVREGVLPVTPGRLDGEAPGSDDPLQDRLVVSHVLHATDGDLPSCPSQDAGPVDDALGGDDKRRRGPAR